MCPHDIGFTAPQQCCAQTSAPRYATGAATVTPLPPRRLIAVMLALGLLLAACGGGGSSDLPESVVSDGTEQSVIPNVDVIEISTGSTVNLSSLTDAAQGRPILLWFWAPH